MASRKPSGARNQRALLAADAENAKAATDAALPLSDKVKDRAKAQELRDRLESAAKAESTGSSVGTKDAVDATPAKPAAKKTRSRSAEAAAKTPPPKTESAAAEAASATTASAAQQAAPAPAAPSPKDTRRLENYGSLVERLRAANQELRKPPESTFNPPQMSAEQAESLRRTMGMSKAEAEAKARNTAKDTRRVQEIPNRIKQLRDANRKIRELQAGGSAEVQGPPSPGYQTTPARKGFFNPVRGPAAALGSKLAPLGGGIKKAAVGLARESKNIAANTAVIGAGAGAVAGTIGYGLAGATAAGKAMGVFGSDDKKGEKKQAKPEPQQQGTETLPAPNENKPAGTPVDTSPAGRMDKYRAKKSVPGNNSTSSIIRRMRGMA